MGFNSGFKGLNWVESIFYYLGSQTNVLFPEKGVSLFSESLLCLWALVAQKTDFFLGVLFILNTLQTRQKMSRYKILRYLTWY